MKKTITIVLIFMLMLLQPMLLSANRPIYNSENEAFIVESQRLRESQSQPGTYPVTIQYRLGDKTMTKTIYVTIVNDPPVTFGTIAIQAQPISVLSNQVATLTSVQWIALAEAHAWNTQTYESIPITIVDTSAVKPEQGMYSVVFGVDEQTTISVQAKVTVLADASASIMNTVAPTNYEHYFTDIPDTFSSFATTGYTILKISVIAMLFIPLLFLLFQYIWTSKALRDVGAVLSKNKKE